MSASAPGGGRPPIAALAPRDAFYRVIAEHLQTMLQDAHDRSAHGSPQEQFVLRASLQMQVDSLGVNAVASSSAFSMLRRGMPAAPPLVEGRHDMQDVNAFELAAVEGGYEGDSLMAPPDFNWDKAGCMVLFTVGGMLMGAGLGGLLGGPPGAAVGAGIGGAVGAAVGAGC